MKCRECGATMQATRENRVQPDMPDMVLRNIEVHRCVLHEEHYDVLIPQMDGLYRTLTSALLAKRTRLAGAEIRCLREVAGWPLATLAAPLGVSSGMLAQVEAGEFAHDGVIDTLIRNALAGPLHLPAPSTELQHTLIDDATPIQALPVALWFKPGGFGPGEWYVASEDSPEAVEMFTFAGYTFPVSQLRRKEPVRDAVARAAYTCAIDLPFGVDRFGRFVEELPEHPESYDLSMVQKGEPLIVYRVWREDLRVFDLGGRRMWLALTLFQGPRLQYGGWSHNFGG